MKYSPNEFYIGSSLPYLNERTKIHECYWMSNQSDNLNYCFFVYVLFADLHLFQDIVLLNPCFIFSKN